VPLPPRLVDDFYGECVTASAYIWLCCPSPTDVVLPKRQCPVRDFHGRVVTTLFRPDAESFWVVEVGF
jgi:hypothetical protein